MENVNCNDCGNINISGFELCASCGTCISGCCQCCTKCNQPENYCDCVSNEDAAFLKYPVKLHWHNGKTVEHPPRQVDVNKYKRAIFLKGLNS